MLSKLFDRKTTVRKTDVVFRNQNKQYGFDPKNNHSMKRLPVSACCLLEWDYAGIQAPDELSWSSELMFLFFHPVCSCTTLHPMASIRNVYFSISHHKFTKYRKLCTVAMSIRMHMWHCPAWNAKNRLIQQMNSFSYFRRCQIYLPTPDLF